MQFPQQFNQNLVSQFHLNNNDVNVTTVTKVVPNDDLAKSTFDFSELQELFLKEGITALVEKLKELKSAGVVEAISVKMDATTGKTTVFVEVDGIGYEFTGVDGDNPTTNPPVNPPTNPPVNPPIKLPPDRDLLSDFTALITGFTALITAFPPADPPADPPTNPPADPPADPPVNPPADPPADPPNIKTDPTIAGKAADAARITATQDLRNIVGNNATIHTEFGLNTLGEIVFQDSETSGVYHRLRNSLLARLRDAGIMEQLGGHDTACSLIQAAWISAYNSYNSSTSNRAVDFVQTVLQNFEQMMNKLKTNPEYFEVFTKRMSYSDSTLTNNLIHYNTQTTSGNDETIRYKGDIWTDNNGVVHIDNGRDDPDYQATMGQLLTFLQQKYSTLPQDVVTKVFREAQKQAIHTLQDNIKDCPYGTGANDGRVEDTNKDWGGSDNRSGDHSNIHMDQLVQITLYYFDKLLIAELVK